MELRIRQKVLGENLGVKAPQRDPYKELRASLAATRIELELNIATGEKATATEKVRAAMDAGKNKDYNGLSSKQKSTVDADVKKNSDLENEIKARDELTKATELAQAEHQKLNDSLTSGITAIQKETDSIRAQTAALTESKATVKDMAALRLETAAENLEIMAKFADGDAVQRDLFLSKAAALREQALAQRELGVGIDTKDATDTLNALLDPRKAMNFGAALSDAFGEVGDSIGKMSKALGLFSTQQEAVEIDRKKFLSLPDSIARTAGLEALDQKETQSKLRMYGAMAGGVKNLFSQHTAAYKVLGVAEQGFRLAELAGTVYNFAVKEGLLTAFTGLFTTAKATEAGVDSAQTVFMLSEHAAAGVADVAITGSTEAAKNTLKIPGVLMSFMSWLGPFGLAAGGVAIAAVLGASLMGGGGGSSTPIDSKARQDKQGTGTVLGDDTAKSASILNSLTGLESNSNIGLVLTSSMLSSLRGIEAAMLGLSTAIYKVPGMTTGRNFGITEGKQGGGFLSSVFGGDTVTSIVDTGLSLNGTAQQFKQGQGIQQYVDVNKQESGGWFSSDSSTNSRDSMMANDEITKTIGRVFDGINATISTAAISLGGNGESIRAALDAFVVNTEVSFKGLKGEELQQALNAVFSASADSMSQLVFPSLVAFQKAGEGYYQTVIRVSTGTEQAQNALKGLGVAMISKDVLTNKTGDFAVEMVRQSIMIEMAGTTIAEVMRLMSGNLSELVDGYKSLLTIQDTMRAAKLGSGGVSMDTIRGAGGLSELKSSLSSFVDNFYTDAEKQSISFSKLHEEFVRLNVVMPESKDAFKSLVSTLMSGDSASQELAGRVLLLGGAFSEAFSMAENAIKDAAAAAKELVKVNQGWMDQLDVLTGKQTDRSLALRDATDDSTRALMRQVYAQQDLKTASEAAKAALETAVNSTKAATADAMAALQRAIAAEKTRISVIRDVAAESVKSITSVFELLKTQVAQLYGTVESTKTMQVDQGNAFIDNALNNASATGYMPDVKQLTEAIAAARGGLSSTQFATQFEADQAALVMAGKLSQLEFISSDQLTVAEQALKTANDQLKALDESLLFYQKQVDAINGVDTSVIRVEQAIIALAAALATQQLIKAQVNAGAVVAAQSYVSSMPADKTYDASAAIPVSERDRAVQAIYSSVLGRVADAGGLADFSNSNLSLSQITANIQGSAEAAARAISVGYQNAFNGAVNANLGLTSTIKAFAAGGDFEGGLRLVGENGPEIEATGPSRIFNAGQTRSMLSSNGANNEQLEMLVGELTMEVKRLQGLVAQGNVNTERTAKAVHGNPDRPMPIDLAESSTTISTKAI